MVMNKLRWLEEKALTDNDCRILKDTLVEKTILLNAAKKIHNIYKQRLDDLYYKEHKTESDVPWD